MDTVREINIHTQCDSMEDLSLYGIEQKIIKKERKENVDGNYIAERLEIVTYSNLHERIELCFPFMRLVTRSHNVLCYWEPAV